VNEHGRTRDPVATRQRIIDAAAAAIVRHGAGASLEVIAREAEVSKGGLLHHFNSKDELLIAVAEHLMSRFDSEVESHLDPSDTEPGRLLRAYVRASLHQLEASAVRDEATLMAALSTIPQVVRVAQLSSRQWRERFADDGVDAARAAVIIRAADGAAAAALFEGQLPGTDVDRLREELLALSRDPGPLPGRPPSPW
jgi:AcrR family transcriptional regulator